MEAAYSPLLALVAVALPGAGFGEGAVLDGTFADCPMAQHLHGLTASGMGFILGLYGLYWG